jgi:membrane-bound lytic murein transglycosylase F
MRVAVVLFAAFLGFSIAGCDDTIESVDAVRERGEIVFVTRNAPTATYLGPHSGLGPEFELATAFAESLGVEAKFRVAETVSDVFAAMEAGEGDIAAAGLTRTPARSEKFLFGPDYNTVREQLVCRRGGPRPSAPSDLVGLEIAVTADSSYIDTLTTLAKDAQGLTWTEESDVTTEELLEQVAAGAIECVVADSTIVAINQRYHPELQVVMDLSEDRPLAWIIGDHAAVLKPTLDAWFADFEASGKLQTIDDRYYAHVDLFAPGGVLHFHARMEDRLGSLRPLFEDAAREYDLSWQLLAAVAYQESHWDPKAKSPTGVRGVMMLTRATAKELGVKDRLNPEQSIYGGARYIRRLMDRLPDEVIGADRLWIALAAYNIGLGHIWDARKLARKLDFNPDTWAGLEHSLPLLAKKKYYRDLKHGYARGSGAVMYVRRVRNYADILAQQTAAEST